MKCEHCKFWKQVATEDRDGQEVFGEINEDTVGECRRHAPRPISYSMSDTVQEDGGYVNFVVWPQVHAGEPGCGEFKRKAIKSTAAFYKNSLKTRSDRIGKGWTSIEDVTTSTLPESSLPTSDERCD